jgi:DNA-binding NarL/FixJ family response regulator
MAIRVLLIEDHFLARMALRSVLSGHSDIVIVGEASDGAGGIELYRNCDGSPLAGHERVRCHCGYS